MKKAFIILFSSVVILACSDIDNCTSDTNQTAMVVRFFDFESKEAKKVGFVVTASGGAGAYSLANDSLAIGLPLDPLDTTVTYFFDSDTNDYQLQIRYNQEFSIFDAGCEPSILFTGIDTLNSSFDSTAILGTVTNSLISTNFEVYF